MGYDAKGRYEVASLTAIIVSNQAGEYVLWVPHEAANSRRAPPRAYLIPCQAKSGSDSAWLSKRYRNGCVLLLLLAELYSPGRISYQRGPLTALVPLKLRL